MGKAVGIDLGTTYSAVAVVDEYGKPAILKNSDGQVTTPSVVFFDPPNYTVGETALQSTITDPDRVVQFIKRFIGQSGYRINIDGTEYSPEFVSALILRKVVKDAAMEMGEDITDAGHHRAGLLHRAAAPRHARSRRTRRAARAAHYQRADGGGALLRDSAARGRQENSRLRPGRRHL